MSKWIFGVRWGFLVDYEPLIQSKTVKIRSALMFACAVYAGFAVCEVHHMHHDPRYSPDLGEPFAFVGMAVFTIFVALLFYVYAWASQQIRVEGPIAASVLSSVLGYPYFFVIWPVQDFLKRALYLPDSIWMIKSLLYCALSFELIRCAHVAWRKATTARKAKRPA